MPQIFRPIRLIRILIIFVCLVGLGCGRINDEPQVSPIDIIQKDFEQGELQKEVETDWTIAYLDYLDQLLEKEPEDQGEFALINLNEDEIPELLISGMSSFGEPILISFYEGKIRENSLGLLSLNPGSYQFTYEKYFYLEEDNLLLTLTKETECYQHTVYALEEGKLEEKGIGCLYFNETEYYGQIPEFDLFLWEDREVTRDEYMTHLNQTFYDAGDNEVLKGITEDRWYDRQDMIRVINNWETAEDKMFSRAKPVATGEMLDWQRAYADYINLELKFYGQGTYPYSLIYIDGDDVPELHVSGHNMAAGQVLCSYYQGKIHASRLVRGLYSYIEGSGLLYNPAWNTGYAVYTVYQLEEGILKEVARGEAQEHVINDSESYETYIWEGQDVSEEEFNQLLNEVYYNLSDEKIGIYEVYDDYDQWFSECAILAEIRMLKET